MLTCRDVGASGNDVSAWGSRRVDRRFVHEGFGFAVEPLTGEDGDGPGVQFVTRKSGPFRRRRATRTVSSVLAAFATPQSGGTSPILSFRAESIEVVDFLLAAIGDAGGACPIWIRSRSLPVLDRVAERRAAVTTIHMSGIGRMDEGPERHLANLRERNIAGLSMAHGDWTGGLVALAHRFERLAVAQPVDLARKVIDFVEMGVDSVSAANSELLVGPDR